MKKTKIQWCHSSVNPVMGCDGCELWPGKGKIVVELATAILASGGAKPLRNIQKVVSDLISDWETSQIYTNRVLIAEKLSRNFGLGKSACIGLVDIIRRACKCYAGLLGTMRSWHEGHASQFEKPQLFAGRTAEAARWKSPGPDELKAKPWLHGTPRMIFISDMGDALSDIVRFEYLKQEIIEVVDSDAGRSHIWLWLTKRPARMAEFGQWLLAEGISWPDNLVAMTTVTSPASANRVAELRQVPSRFKGLSCEPVFAELHLDLTGIDWVIMGGGSDTLAESFQVEWALSLREQCHQANAAFFLKQLGRNALFKGQPLNLVDEHGGDWTEWAAEWKTRAVPEAFRTSGTFMPSKNGVLFLKTSLQTQRASVDCRLDFTRPPTHGRTAP
jgi:protein gp37